MSKCGTELPILLSTYSYSNASSNCMQSSPGRRQSQKNLLLLLHQKTKIFLLRKYTAVFPFVYKTPLFPPSQNGLQTNIKLSKVKAKSTVSFSRHTASCNYLPKTIHTVLTLKP